MKASMRKSALPAAVLASLVAVTFSCGDGGDGNGNGMGPEEPTGQYAAQAQAVLDVVDDYFSENEAVSSVEAVASLIIDAGFDFSPALAVLRLSSASLGTLVGALDEAPARIPANLKGTVWVLQDAPLGYVEDTGQTGPGEGVRFILYDIDLTTGLPSTPLQPIGHLDIIESAVDPDDADFNVVIGEASLVDLAIDATIGQMLQLTVSGTISNGVQPLNVSLFASGTVDQGTFDINADVSLSNSMAEIDVAMTASGTLANPNITTGTTVFIPGTFFVIGFFSEWDGSSFDGSVSVGADQVAFISGSENDVTLEPIGGSGASADDLQGLELMFEGIDGMFDDSLGIIGLIFAIVGYSLL